MCTWCSEHNGVELISRIKKAAQTEGDLRRSTRPGMSQEIKTKLASTTDQEFDKNGEKLLK